MDNPILQSDEFLNALPVGVLVLDAGCHIRNYNDMAMKFLAIEITDLIADDLENSVLNKEFISFITRLKETGSKQERVVFEVHGRRMNCVAQRICFQEEESVIVTLEDATKVKEFEDFKHEFIDAILHRIRAPLSTLETTLAIVTSNKAGSLEPKIKTILDMSYQEVIRLHSLTKDLRDLFFIETGLMGKELEWEECEIGKALERALAEISRMPAPFDAVKQRVKIEGETGITVHADFDKVKQILVNILKNAVLFSPNNELIRVRVSSHPGYSSVQIQDQGIGISDNAVGFVFDKFFREDNLITRKTPGNGLGLYNAKALAELMGGVLFCESEKGKGSSFWVNLPSKQGKTDCAQK
jgi:signal transduction histidine kinase